MIYRTIDLCAGIGGIRRAFERTGVFNNVLSAEIDKYACLTYEHLYNENPYNDLTTEKFKLMAENTPYDILLAGFPCQTFSRAGLREGFENEEKGIIFSHITQIIERTKPKGIFLENVDHLITHNKGETFNHIIEVLEIELNYKIIGVTRESKFQLKYDSKEFIRNSRMFGVPQNRPRTYIIGFSRDKYGDLADSLVKVLPEKREMNLYNDLQEILEENVDLKYYVSSGYLETLEKHRERQKAKKNGFGYRIVNLPEIKNPIANTLLATGGSGKERNLIYQPNPLVNNQIINGKKSPLNNRGIRVMTPREWAKLQGFVNYAFVDDNGIDTFSFPDGISDTQQYKQLGNSVTIPVIESMAKFMLECLELLEN
ncbi:MAG TPA: DNA (cytosine-5-)-methyltransferase [Bacillus sp. (in: Bacteria)]|nr:DNA (cytosine-5-)-methyltransferase [Bacillus sp. (in: firmicutes)]